MDLLKGGHRPSGCAYGFFEGGTVLRKSEIAGGAGAEAVDQPVDFGQIVGLDDLRLFGWGFSCGGHDFDCSNALHHGCALAFGRVEARYARIFNAGLKACSTQMPKTAQGPSPGQRAQDDILR